MKRPPGRSRNTTGQKRSWPDCRHCQKRSGCRSRGLCNRCWSDVAIRAQYQPVSPFAPRGEPTEAELEETIRQQMARLPSWWSKEVARME